jgi:hypothetical protein
VSIQERRHARPTAKDVPIDLNPREAGAHGCIRGRVAWYAFDYFVAGGRSLYVFVVMGERASARVRRELDRVLNSLRFTPRRSHGSKYR